MIKDSLDTLNTLNIFQDLIDEILSSDRVQYMARNNMYIIRKNILLEWYEFYISEKKNLSEKDYNKFRSIFDEIFQYLAFLQITEDSYYAYSQDYLDNAKSENAISEKRPIGIVLKMSVEEKDLWNKRRIIETYLKREIESFYQYAKILLDKTAIAVEFYFKRENDIPLSSFRTEFTKNFEEYARKKNLSSYENLLSLAIKLKEDISFFRDKRIVHLYNDRITNRESVARGMAFRYGKGELPTELPIISIIAAHRDNDKKTENSKQLPELLTDIYMYIGQIFIFIKANKEKKASWKRRNESDSANDYMIML